MAGHAEHKPSPSISTKEFSGVISSTNKNRGPAKHLLLKGPEFSFLLFGIVYKIRTMPFPRRKALQCAKDYVATPQFIIHSNVRARDFLTEHFCSASFLAASREMNQRLYGISQQTLPLPLLSFIHVTNIHGNQFKRWFFHRYLHVVALINVDKSFWVYIYGKNIFFTFPGASHLVRIGSLT